MIPLARRLFRSARRFPRLASLLEIVQQERDIAVQRIVILRGERKAIAERLPQEEALPAELLELLIIEHPGLATAHSS